MTYLPTGYIIILVRDNLIKIKYIKRNGEKLFSIAMAYSPSLVERIESDPWDERMDALIVGER